MIVDIDPIAFRKAGLIYNQLDEDLAEFWFVDRPERVRVKAQDGKLHFVERRSAGHRDVLNALELLT